MTSRLWTRLLQMSQRDASLILEVETCCTREKATFLEWLCDDTDSGRWRSCIGPSSSFYTRKAGSTSSTTQMKSLLKSDVVATCVGCICDMLSGCIASICKLVLPRCQVSHWVSRLGGGFLTHWLRVRTAPLIILLLTPTTWCLGFTRALTSPRLRPPFHAITFVLH